MLLEKVAVLGVDVLRYIDNVETGFRCQLNSDLCHE